MNEFTGGILAYVRKQTKMMEIAERRTQVAELYAKGYFAHQIADRLNIKTTMVNQDVKFIKEQFRNSMNFQMEEYVGSELMRLQHMQKVAWEEFERSGVEEVVKTTAEGEKSTQKTHKAKDVRYLKYLYDIIVLRSKLLGVCSPNFSNLNTNITVNSHNNPSNEAKQAMAELSALIKNEGFVYKDEQIIEDAEASKPIDVDPA